jgi:CBS domain-containing protein
MTTSVRQLLAGKGRAVYSVEPQAPVLEAIRLMAEHQVGALLVMTGEVLNGIVSERDYARKVILLGRSSAATPVRDIMSTPVISVSLEETIPKCMQLMTEHRVRHLPVTDGARVIGMVSIGDLVKAVIAEQRQQIEQLESYIHS